MSNQLQSSKSAAPARFFYGHRFDPCSRCGLHSEKITARRHGAFGSRITFSMSYEIKTELLSEHGTIPDISQTNGQLDPSAAEPQ
jgi:hypothetical protein